MRVLSMPYQHKLSAFHIAYICTDDRWKIHKRMNTSRELEKKRDTIRRSKFYRPRLRPHRWTKHERKRNLIDCTSCTSRKAIDKLNEYWTSRTQRFGRRKKYALNSSARLNTINFTYVLGIATANHTHPWSLIHTCKHMNNRWALTNIKSKRTKENEEKDDNGIRTITNTICIWTTTAAATTKMTNHWKGNKAATAATKTNKARSSHSSDIHICAGTKAVSERSNEANEQRESRNADYEVYGNEIQQQ